jgi:hypothetical protein
MTASSLLLAPAEDPASHTLHGLAGSCVRLKISPALPLPGQNRVFFKRQVFNNFVLTEENNHE